MSELPLFPLNTVLFPGAPLHLHIFEERYKRMMRLCLQEKRPFGVVLIRRGLEALGPLADPHPVGCAAEIVHTQPLEGGRMNLMAMGKERFRILRLNNEAQPYLVGEVEPYPLLLTDPAAAAGQARKLRKLVSRYLQALARAGQVQVELAPLPEAPVELAYTAAALVQVPDDQKQALLSAETAFDLLFELQRIYRREAALLKAIMLGGKAKAGPFSVN